MADQPASQGSTTRRLADGRDDTLVREEPLLLVVHGQQLLTMRTPGRDEDLAVGFLLGEGVIAGTADVQRLEARAGDPTRRRSDELHVTLRQVPDAKVRATLTRTHEIRSSCGVCGVADVQTMLDELPPLLPGVPKLRLRSVRTLVAALQHDQPLFRTTGGSHGALLATADGERLGGGEDVGRHNALDKAIGEAARAGHQLSSVIAVLSGRAGYDLVVKCLRARIAVIVSVSAPSALAFDLCQAAGATLIGFARGDRHTVYCGAERLLA